MKKFAVYDQTGDCIDEFDTYEDAELFRDECYQDDYWLGWQDFDYFVVEVEKGGEPTC